MDEQLRASEADVYAASLDFTLKELQRKLRDHQAELDRVRTHASRVVFCQNRRHASF